MLVLTRKPGQSIMIGDEIEVEVLAVSGEKIRLGITAPRDVEIFRHEVFERIQEEREADEEREANEEPEGAADASENGTFPSPVGRASAEPAAPRRR